MTEFSKVDWYFKSKIAQRFELFFPWTSNIKNTIIFMISAIKHILRSQRKSEGWWLRPSNCHARCCSLCCWFGSFEVEKWTYGSSSNGGSWHSPIHGAGTDGGPKIQLQSRHLFIRDHPVWNFDSVFYRYGEDPITDEFTQIRVPEEFCCTVSCRGMKFTESKKNDRKH